MYSECFIICIFFEGFGLELEDRELNYNYI